MRPTDFAVAFDSLQQQHMADLLRSHSDEFTNFGDLYALLNNRKLGPILRNVRVRDVFTAQPTHAAKVLPALPEAPLAQPEKTKVVATSQPSPKRKSPTLVPHAKRTEIKRAFINALEIGHKTTGELQRLGEHRFVGLPSGFAYKLLVELELSNIVHRVHIVDAACKPANVSILWGIGGDR